MVERKERMQPSNVGANSKEEENARWRRREK
jgi:hypothetical protein